MREPPYKGTTLAPASLVLCLFMSKNFAEALQGLERQYPLYETDMSIREQNSEIYSLPKRPKAAKVGELLGDLDYHVGRLTPGSYSQDELLFWLERKLPAAVWEYYRAIGERKAQTLNHMDLSIPPV